MLSGKKLMAHICWNFTKMKESMTPRERWWWIFVLRLQGWVCSAWISERSSNNYTKVSDSFLEFYLCKSKNIGTCIFEGRLCSLINITFFRTQREESVALSCSCQSVGNPLCCLLRVRQILKIGLTNLLESFMQTNLKMIPEVKEVMIMCELFIYYGVFLTYNIIFIEKCA